MDLTNNQIGAILNTTTAAIHRDNKFYDIDNNEVIINIEEIAGANSLLSDISKYTLKVSVDKLLTYKIEFARQAIAGLTNRRVTSLGVNTQYSIYKSTHTATTLGIYEYEFTDVQKASILLDVKNGEFTSSLWDKLYLSIDNGGITTYDEIVSISDKMPVTLDEMTPDKYAEVLSAV